MSGKHRAKVDLADALRAYRAGPEEAEALSDASRSAVFRAISQGGPERRMARLFLPVRRLAFAGSVPLALAAVLVLWTAGSVPPGAPMSGTAKVQASKVGDHVVFTIANGGRDHQVSRSDRADRFEAEAAETVSDGSFRDRLHDGSELVFYRID